MKCAICKYGHTELGQTTIAFEKNASVIVFQKVPVEICNNCGEEYVSSNINSILTSSAAKEFSRGISFELLNYSSSFSDNLQANSQYI
jgi:YgiT-type zinc finger domain-containing protein